MSRSRNLANYETLYWDLLAGMQGGIPEIHLKLTKKDAINAQQTFYAFIHALEHAAAIKIIASDIKHGQELTNNANIMRGYIVTVRHNETNSILSFINRDLNPKTQDFRDQLHEQLKAHAPGITSEDMKEVQTKASQDLFQNPLKVINDE